MNATCHRFAMGVALAILLAGIPMKAAATAPVDRTTGPAPLFSGLGDHHHPITTDQPLAQRYFDQGLTLMYGFNHPEAIRSFEAAATVDPECAMAYWGIAAALGPNINAPMSEEAVPKAYAALQKAQELAPQVSEREQAYIAALSKRYVAEPVEDRSALDQAYAEAMREVAARYPDDLDASTLFAEAVMDTMPWDYWTEDLTPKPATQEIKAVLERVMVADPTHPGANHLYIHVVEAGPNPAEGAPAADRLSVLVPDAGHLVHMPGHIYVRVGRYHDAVEANHRAVAADESYIAQCRVQGFYPLMYYPHNMHFLWYAAAMGGERDEAVDAAQMIGAHHEEELSEAERLRPMLVLTYVRFGQWDELLALPAPPAEHTYDRGLWHFGRTLALLRTGRVDEAATEAAALDRIATSDAAKELEVANLYGQTQLTIADLIVQGELAGAQGDDEAMVRRLREAVALEDGLPYMEPPYWPIPVRHMLGEALLRAGQPAEAEAVYREDLARNPGNGWALMGLSESLLAQGKTDAAREVDEQFAKAWQHAETPIAASSY